MTTSTQVMWTCLPNGVVTTSTGAIASPLTLQLSVVVTPQVSGTSIQGTVFQNWPAYVRAITAANAWTVTFGGDYAATAAPALNYTSASGKPTDAISANTAFNVDGTYLWQAIFPVTTPVLTTQTSTTLSPVSQYKIHSFDAGTIATAIRAAHRYTVESHLQHGKLVLTGTDPYSFLLAERKKAKRVLPKMAAAIQGVARGAVHHVLRQAYQAETGDLGLGYELMRHALFYDHEKFRANARARRAGMAPEADDGGTAAGSQALHDDFNTLLSHLAGQPKLLRKLGLVIDLVLTPPKAVQQWIATLEQQSPGTIVPAPNQAWSIQMTTPVPSSLPTGVSVSVSHVGPVTSSDLTATLFRTTVIAPPSATTGGSITSGYLPLGDATQYSAYTEDTEGTPIKLDMTTSSTGATTTTTTDGASTGIDLASPFPALRTAGVAIAQIGRDTNLDNAFARQSSFTNAYWLNQDVPGNVTLYADDVIRGYAIDVQITNPYGSTPTTTPYTSICRRNTRMYFPTLAGVSGVPSGTAGSFMINDEGYTKASVANAPGNGDELDLHSALWGWEGWSLAAQRPGRAIVAATPAGDTVQTETPTQPVNTPASNFPNCQFIVGPLAGSLPRLRFGYTYSFRARILDLAGNDMSVPNTVAGVPAPTLNVPANTTTTPQTPAKVVNPIPSGQITYLRYEPVPNPVVVLQAPLTEGEHLENLVIRSNPWGPLQQNAAAYATYVNGSTSGINPMNDYVVPCARWAAPPKGSWSQAEQMGALDANYFDPLSSYVSADLKSGAITAGLPYSAATFLPLTNALFLASQKEAGLFTDTQIWDSSNTSSLVPSGVNNAQVITPPGAQNLPPPTNPGQPMAPGQYNILVPNTSGKGPSAYIPYIPDANALGIAIQILDGSGNPISGASGQRTYAPRPSCVFPEIDMPQFQLLDGGAGGVAGAGWVTTLPSIGGSGANQVGGLDGSGPASSAPITFTLAPGQVQSFTYGSVVADLTKMANGDIQPTSANKPQTIPTFAPFRTISMVHAVQQPKPPFPLGGVASWAAGFNVPARNQNDTSITILGGFNVDTLTSQSCDFTASWVEYLDVEMSSNMVQATDGTNVRYTVKEGRIGSWSFDTPTLAATEITFNSATAAAPSTTSTTGATPPTTSGAIPTSSASPTPLTLPPFSFQFGDTKTRLITLQATATTRFREFFPASLQSNSANFQNSTPLGALSAGQLMSAGMRIPSTARPKAPEILYVVPTYGWTTAASSTSRPVSSTTTNTRTGRGLRVFVGRPWFTTGDGEQLAVLVSGSTAPAGYISQWGMDPIRNSQSASLVTLDSTQIPSGNVVSGVPLAEFATATPELTATIVTFNPAAYDEVRQLWYFDVELTTNTPTTPNAVEAPFVRLALARYQANSLGAPAYPAASACPDLRLSTVVLADMIKLGADRTASYVVNSVDTVTVTVSGYVFADQPWGPPTSVAVTTANPAAAHGRMMFAQILETKATSPGEFDWYPMPGTTVVSLTPYQTPGAASGATLLSFSAAVAKPASITAGTKHQLLLTEVEYFNTDAEAAFPGTQTVNNFPGANQSVTVNGTVTSVQSSQVPANTSSRVVFSDVLPLPY